MDSPTDFADRLRGMIQHETELVNHRMTWFLASQTLLFAAIGVVWEKNLLIQLTLALVGIVIGVSFHVSIQAAIRAVQRLEQCWLEKCNAWGIDPQAEPPINGLYRTQIKPIERFLFPWRLLPWFLSAVWVFLGVAKCLAIV